MSSPRSTCSAAVRPTPPGRLRAGHGVRRYPADRRSAIHRSGRDTDPRRRSRRGAGSSGTRERCGGHPCDRHPAATPVRGAGRWRRSRPSTPRPAWLDAGASRRSSAVSPPRTRNWPWRSAAMSQGRARRSSGSTCATAVARCTAGPRTGRSPELLRSWRSWHCGRNHLHRHRSRRDLMRPRPRRCCDVSRRCTATGDGRRVASAASRTSPPALQRRVGRDRRQGALRGPGRPRGSDCALQGTPSMTARPSA